MRKRSRSSTVVTVEWNAEAGRVENLSDEDLIALARAFGRLAARRDLARAQTDQAKLLPHSGCSVKPTDAEPPKRKAKTLNVTE